MVNLNKAMSDLAEIRAHLDRTETYRGFRSLTVGVSGLLVFVAGLVQQHLRNNEQLSLANYLTVWFSVAGISILLAAVEMVVRGRISSNPNVWKMHGRLVLGLLPALLAGAAMTPIVCSGISPNSIDFDQDAQLAAWALPFDVGSVLQLGIVLLFKPLGQSFDLDCVVFPDYFLGFDGHWGHLHPKRQVGRMPAIFGLGQIGFGALLYWNSERHHD